MDLSNGFINLLTVFMFGINTTDDAYSVSMHKGCSACSSALVEIRDLCPLQLTFEIAEFLHGGMVPLDDVETVTILNSVVKTEIEILVPHDLSIILHRIDLDE